MGGLVQIVYDRAMGAPGPASALADLARAIARGDSTVVASLRASPELARAALPAKTSRGGPTGFFLDEIMHQVYGGDTLLHVAAAAYALDVARELLGLGANVHAANRRGAQPLHYAADGGPGLATWSPRAQAAIVALLIEAGADPNAVDKSGVAPLHRAARTRCTGAVRALLAGGADPRRTNRSGSTALDLASSTTGRGGSGSAEARREQEIIRRLLWLDNI